MSPYVLITPAHNEAALIGQTIEAVCAQTVLPRRWVIVSDGSTDETDAIVRRYQQHYDFIQLLRREKQRSGHDYTSKVFAIREGIAQLADVDYAFIGMLDADISFAPDYYHDLLEEFAANPRLGLAGGLLWEPDPQGRWQAQSIPYEWSVSGPIQLFRRECYEAIGGYLALPNGEDAISEVMARMRGWEVRTFPALLVKHHRPTYSAKGSLLQQRYWEGGMDYGNGTHPLFQIARGLKRLGDKPYVLGGLALIAGFYWHWLRRKPILIPDEVRRYLRREQLGRLRALFIRPPTKD